MKFSGHLKLMHVGDYLGRHKLVKKSEKLIASGPG